MPNSPANDQDRHGRKEVGKGTHAPAGRRKRAKGAAQSAIEPALADIPSADRQTRPPLDEVVYMNCPYCSARVREKRLEKHKSICPKSPSNAGPPVFKKPPVPARTSAPRSIGRHSPSGRPMGRPSGGQGGPRQRDRHSKKEFGVVAYSETDLAFREAQKRFHETQAREDNQRDPKQ
jgi:hypothetical protein